MPRVLWFSVFFPVRLPPRQTMARTAVTGSCLLLLTLHLLSAAAATPGKTSDREGKAPMWPFDRQSSTSAHNQPLADDNEGSEADYDDALSPWQRHDARSNDDNDNDDSNDDDDDDDETSSKASYDVVVDDKRKWSKNNVRIWGKRRWSSKGLNLWGKRRSNGTAAEILRGGGGGSKYGDDAMTDVNNRPVETVGGRNDNDDKRKWAKNNLKIWGKRRFPDDKSSDQEIAMNRVEGGRRYGQEEGYYPIMRDTLLDHFPGSLHKRNSLSSVEQKYGKKGWANNNVRIWG